MVNSQDWLLEQLPRVMAEDPFIHRYVSLIQEIASGVRKQVDDVPLFVDVHVAPESFVRWMGQWLGLAVEPAVADPEERERRLRRLVEEVGSLYVRRGTAAGLEGLLNAITGDAAHVDDTGGVFRTGQAPANAKHAIVYLNGTGGVDEQALLRLVSQEIPVDTTFEFRIGVRRIVEEADEEMGLEQVARAVVEAEASEDEGDTADEGEAMPAWATADAAGETPVEDIPEAGASLDADTTAESGPTPDEGSPSGERNP
ncbi:MAG: phage tail protein [Dehalococcoidia bacterium]